jgi:hypothetical protein
MILSTAMAEVNGQGAGGQRPGKSRDLGCRHLPTWVDDPEFLIPIVRARGASAICRSGNHVEDLPSWRG